MFHNCKNLISLDLSNFDTSNVTRGDYLFSGCSSLTLLNLSNFNTSKIKDMEYMFGNCFALVNVIGSIDLTSCTSVKWMFYSCNDNANIHLKNVPRSLDFSTSSGTEGKEYIIDNYID